MRLNDAIRKGAIYISLACALGGGAFGQNKEHTGPKYDALRMLKDSGSPIDRYWEIRSVIRRSEGEMDKNQYRIYRTYSLLKEENPDEWLVSIQKNSLEVGEERKLIAVPYYAKSLDCEVRDDMESAIANMDTCIILNPFNKRFYNRRARLNEALGNEEKTYEDRGYIIMLDSIKPEDKDTGTRYGKNDRYAYEG